MCPYSHTHQNDEVLAFRNEMDSTISSDIARECSEKSAEDIVVVEKDKRNNNNNIEEELCSKLLGTIVLQPSVCIIGSILHPRGKNNKFADHIMVRAKFIVMMFFHFAPLE